MMMPAEKGTVEQSDFGTNVSYTEIVNAGGVFCGEFKEEWQAFPEFQSWLRPVPENKTKAWCRACEKIFKADLKALRVHGVGKSHIRLVQAKFPEHAMSRCAPPSVGYNVITDRKGTYGIGVINKHGGNTGISGNTLYVDPTNPGTNILTCDPKQDKDSYVIVSLPNSSEEKMRILLEQGGEEDQPAVDVRDMFDDAVNEEISNFSIIDRYKKELAKGFERSEQEMLGDVCSADDLISTEDVDDPNMTESPEIPDEKVTIIKSNHTKKYRIDIMVGEPAPYWEGSAVINGQVQSLKLTDFAGKYLVFIFYQRDFCDLCSEEITALSDRYEEFLSFNTDVVACSVDSVLVHQAWCRVGTEDGGVSFPKIPLLSDANHTISKTYGTLIPEEGFTARYHSPVLYISELPVSHFHLSIQR